FTALNGKHFGQHNKPMMKPGIALLLTLFIACPAAPVQTAEPQQDLQAKSDDPTGALDHPDVNQRIQRLRQLVRETKEAAALAVDSYRPTMKGPVDDLSTPVPDILRQLPGVAKVSVHKPVDRPTHRIVHLTDWHFLSKALFAADIRDVAGESVSDAKIDDLYEELLLEVELVQIEQKTVLRCLVKHNGLRRVFCEGLTKEDMLFYKLKVAALRRVEKQIPDVREQIEEAVRTMAEMEKAGEENSDDYRLAAEIRAELESLLYQHRLDLLRVGAAGQLFMAGELEEVVPVDDEGLLAQANPVAEDGKVNLDREVIEARQDAQVRTMIEGGRFVLVILGGAHDLANNVAKLAGRDGEYVRVTTRWGQRFGRERAE
ncbi:MAG: hypothetical protein ABIP48_15310, partial [Planctomycetota bacterium]